MYNFINIKKYNSYKNNYRLRYKEKNSKKNNNARFGKLFKRGQNYFHEKKL